MKELRNEGIIPSTFNTFIILGNSRIICDAGYAGCNITNDINSSKITILQHYNITTLQINNFAN